MAEITLGPTPPAAPGPSGSQTVPADPPQDVITDLGLSVDELSDPNKIQVTIHDTKSPIVVFFGAPACGKTMTLIRLTRYLKQQGYTIQADGAFRPHYDEHYRKLCENFDTMVNNSDAAEGTDHIAFMLVKVSLHGRTICQLLEAPGEGYFQISQPQAQFPAYINNIINGNNRKVWAIMVEPNTTNPRMADIAVRRAYADKIGNLKTKLNTRDKVLFVYNKIDQTNFVVSPGVIRLAQAKTDVEQNYPNIFVPFKNPNPISKWWKPYNFGFLAFHTGDYNETSTGSLTFTQGNDAYPRNLWKSLLDCIKG